ncbi:hypothetical protein EV385_6293 [Krasilnikovia cinnamomea]|uniref:Uncharacterized protein n=1 Tax=Krasilnikovia cinnamomea TaxID=349313 RepID=A0A4Q7ZT12_9ACTN|nr:hypothetical protein [Krasilnikovia cinnamomea]RZU54342.1 hypothetical protein EV385_6293 [Krasilnikovia cinnamomea]
MSVGAIGSTPFAVIAAGQQQDPYSQQAQVNAQADLLNALVSSDLPMKLVVANLSDGRGVDLYL